MTNQTHQSGSYKSKDSSMQFTSNTSPKRPKPQKEKSKKGISFVTLLIVMITTAFVTFVVYKNFDNIEERVVIQTDDSQDKLFVGDSVLLEGVLTKDGDGMKYTHRLHNAEYGSLGLRSSVVNLNKYEGQVKIRGVVADVYAGLYIIDVENIEGREIVDLTGENEINEETQYFADAGLFFNKSFLENYNISTSGGNIALTNTNTENDIEISYFRCDNSDMNTNCLQLDKDYDAAAGKKIVTSAGISFYRLGDSTKRYFHNADFRGYRIIGVEEQELASLAEKLVFVDENFVNESVLPVINKLCYNSETKISEVTDHELYLKNGELELKVTGKTFDANAECILRVDPTITLGAQKLTFEIVELDEEDEEPEEDIEDAEDGTTEEDSEEKSEDTTVNRDTTVTQFPIKLESALTFSSSRGYKVIFPAGNISWRAGSASDPTMGQAGVNCRATLDVDKYEEGRGDTIENPKLKVHECTIKNGFDTGEKFRHIVVQDDRHFIIEILDPAWINFAENIVIE